MTLNREDAGLQICASEDASRGCPGPLFHNLNLRSEIVRWPDGTATLRSTPDGRWTPGRVAICQFDRVDRERLGVRRRLHLAAYLKYLVPTISDMELSSLGLDHTQHTWVKLEVLREAEDWCLPHLQQGLRLFWFLEQVTLKDLDKPPRDVLKLVARVEQEYPGL